MQKVAQEYFSQNPDMVDNPNATALRACMPTSPSEQSASELVSSSIDNVQSHGSDEMSEADKSHRNCDPSSHVTQCASDTTMQTSDHSQEVLTQSDGRPDADSCVESAETGQKSNMSCVNMTSSEKIDVSDVAHQESGKSALPAHVEPLDGHVDRNMEGQAVQGQQQSVASLELNDEDLSYHTDSSEALDQANDRIEQKLLADSEEEYPSGAENAATACTGNELSVTVPAPIPTCPPVYSHT